MSLSREQLQQLPNRELYMSVYLSQAFMLSVALGISALFGNGIQKGISQLTWHWHDGLWQGASFAIIVLIINLLLYRVVPARWLDDGGINDRVFRSMGICHMVFFCLVVAIVEEWLFRGVLQPLVGLPVASICFALVHVRYIKKPILFFYTLLLSIALGLLYEGTGNFCSVVVAHFLINFLLGVFLRKSAKRRVIGV
ncbi:CPBP family intramembrane glutamic endopeptidase [Shouchella lonarensis]|uniref:CAAX prenyl protease 2/Lysostaphin resistance protein A-like domain-containing protein n=1 Tax=Shouchella lonarensis TaxID=1464122 RepID=A0A1G6LH34_9BACI|nr:CPBP family intramembrane glutamic endopeptidase [Shouchella lonarensis]SDC41876.1 hypothetical protein SAMN05421737_108107 [Shouchella lonarensis]